MRSCVLQSLPTRASHDDPAFMHTSLVACQLVLLLGVVVGSVCWVATLGCALFFRSRRLAPTRCFDALPAVSLLKPVYGLEKDLEQNLRTACLQDYPEYQVVYSVQRADDPAIPLLRALASEFGSERATVAIESANVGHNGKINNLVGALRHARHDVLVVSDSDIHLRPDFLRQIVAPLADLDVGAVSTFFRGVRAGSWYEHMELLSLNADQFAMAMLASATGLVDFCLGASTALTRETLSGIGGFERLGDYLVEDNELGRRVLLSGKRLVVIPYVVDTTIDLRSPAQWWQKQTYWDLNSKAAVPAVFAASLLLRTIPLSVLFAWSTGWSSLGLVVIAIAALARLGAVAAVLGVALRDGEGIRRLWLVPIKDVLSLIWYARAFVTRRVVWRGVEMSLARDGRLMAIASSPPAETQAPS